MRAAITNWSLSLEQFLALPEAKPALEYGPDGEVTQKPLPTFDHATLQLELGSRLRDYARQGPKGAVLTELRVVLGGLARVPDVCYYRQERVPHRPDGRVQQHPTTAPDLVVEIFSPDQEARSDLLGKAAWYLGQGVEVVLLVDPERRRVSVFTAEGEIVCTGDSRVPLDAVLPGFQVTPAELFSALDPPERP
jgi:Uma2 family endonuclease